MLRIAGAAGAAVLLAVQVPAVGASAHGSATVTCDGKWRVVHSPTDHNNNTSLSTVFAASPRHVWAGGFAGLTGLIEDWDGSSWGIVDDDGISNSTEAQVYGTTGTTAHDVWAVGRHGNFTTGHALTVHWDGDKWKAVPSPKISGVTLNSASANIDDDVWAVGFHIVTSPNYAQSVYIQRWNGSVWHEVAAPSLANGGELTSVSALHSDDVWAVGTLDTGPERPLILHWDGSRWTRVDANIPSAYGNAVLVAVSANTVDDAWAVGYTDDPQSGARQALVERWNGSAWRVVATPSSASHARQLLGVAAVASDDVWAVGAQDFASESEDVLIERWNGSKWTLFIGPTDAGLTRVSADSATDVWAVGNQTTSANVVRPLVMHRCTH